MEIVSAIAPAVAALVAAAVGYGWGRLRAYVESTEVEWDDRIFNAVQEAIRQDREERGE